MENGPPRIGFEDGTIDVERLLVEPHDGHYSVDSVNVTCCTEKTPPIAMRMEDVPHKFGLTDIGIAQEEEYIFSGDVLDAVHSELEDGYFRLQNDFCGMGEEYFLGVDLAESITNLDYTSTQGLQTSLSHSQLDIDTPWKADIFGITEVSEYQNDHLNVDRSEFVDIPRQFHDISSCSFHDTLSDEKDTGISPSVEILHSPNNEKNGEFGLNGQSGETNRFHGQDALVSVPARARQKRSRKPTQKYIEELAVQVLRHSKRRRDVSSSNLKDRSEFVDIPCQFHDISSCSFHGTLSDENDTRISSSVEILCSPKNEKNGEFGLTGQSGETNRFHGLDALVTVPARARQKRSRKPTQRYIEEPAIQVLRHSKRRRDVSSSNLEAKSLAVRDHQKCHMRSILEVTLPAEECSVKAIQVPFASLVHKECPGNDVTSIKQDLTTASKGNGVTPEDHKKTNEYATSALPKRREVSGRRKHHRLWTNAEVRTLIDGVSEHGVGRWTLIKKLFFSSSAHRTSVDLKDKWRNLLKASGIQGKGSRQGRKRRNMAWRSLPKSIRRRVCKLAVMFPYPKGQTPKIGHIRHVSPDISTDITLSDYRRIIQNMNGK